MSTELHDGAVILSPRPVPVRRGIHPVTAALRQRFESSAYAELRNVDCTFRMGHLTLNGEVSSFYLKQLATSLAASVDGVEQIDNRLDVVDFRTPLRPFPA